MLASFQAAKSLASPTSQHGARHSQLRVSGAVLEGVWPRVQSDTWSSRSVRFRTCEMRSVRFRTCEMRSVRFRTCEIAKCTVQIVPAPEHFARTSHTFRIPKVRNRTLRISFRKCEIGHFAFRKREIGHSDASRAGHYGARHSQRVSGADQRVSGAEQSEDLQYRRSDGSRCKWQYRPHFLSQRVFAAPAPF
eukprot:COSAG02_NODE_1383_length_12965_cov_60.828463_7_plen_192_part_00